MNAFIRFKRVSRRGISILMHTKYKTQEISIFERKKKSIFDE